MRELASLGISTDDATANKDAKEAAILRLCKQQFTINKQIHLRMQINQNFSDPAAFKAARFTDTLVDNHNKPSTFYCIKLIYFTLIYFYL